jgi:hypothetical protein
MHRNNRNISVILSDQEGANGSHHDSPGILYGVTAIRTSGTHSVPVAAITVINTTQG